MPVMTESIVKMNETVVGDIEELMALLRSIHSGNTANVQPFFESGDVSARWVLGSDGNSFTQVTTYKDEATFEAFTAARRDSGYVTRTEALGWTWTKRRI